MKSPPSFALSAPCFVTWPWIDALMSLPFISLGCYLYRAWTDSNPAAQDPSESKTNADTKSLVSASRRWLASRAPLESHFLADGWKRMRWLCAVWIISSLPSTLKSEEPGGFTCQSKVEDSYSSLTPGEVVNRLRKAHEKTKSACVGKIGESGASGVVVSESGLVFTAGHFLENIKLLEVGEREYEFDFYNGSEGKAIALGYNRTNDTGAFRITKGEYSHAKIAEEPAKIGDFCYLAGQPMEDSARLRLGRITGLIEHDGEPLYYCSDLMIQPGDSGAGVFSLDGELIAIANSAGPHPQVNHFTVISRFLKDRERLEEKERWGTSFTIAHKFDSFSPEEWEEAARVFETRRTQGERYLTEYIRKKGGDFPSQLPIEDKAYFIPELLTNPQTFPIPFGMEEPSLVELLPSSDPNHLAVPLKLVHEEKKLETYAVRVTETRFVAKLSQLIFRDQEIIIASKDRKYIDVQIGGYAESGFVKLAPTGSSVKSNTGKDRFSELMDKIDKPAPQKFAIFKESGAIISLKFRERQSLSVPAELVYPQNGYRLLTPHGESVDIRMIKQIPEHDLAVLELATPGDANSIQSPILSGDLKGAVATGSGLIAIDPYGKKTWGIVCRDLGASDGGHHVGMIEEFRVDRFHLQFPAVITHSLPLFNPECGTPVYDFDGKCVGIHIARTCRAYGMILPLQVIFDEIAKIDSSTPASRKSTSTGSDEKKRLAF